MRPPSGANERIRVVFLLIQIRSMFVCLKLNFWKKNYIRHQNRTFIRNTVKTCKKSAAAFHLNPSPRAVVVTLLCDGCEPVDLYQDHEVEPSSVTQTVPSHMKLVVLYLFI